MVSNRKSIEEHFCSFLRTELSIVYQNTVAKYVSLHAQMPEGVTLDRCFKEGSEIMPAKQHPFALQGSQNDINDEKVPHGRGMSRQAEDAQNDIEEEDNKVSRSQCGDTDGVTDVSDPCSQGDLDWGPSRSGSMSSSSQISNPDWYTKRSRSQSGGTDGVIDLNEPCVQRDLSWCSSRRGSKISPSPSSRECSSCQSKEPVYDSFSSTLHNVQESEKCESEAYALLDAWRSDGRISARRTSSVFSSFSASQESAAEEDDFDAVVSFGRRPSLGYSSVVSITRLRRAVRKCVMAPYSRKPIMWEMFGLFCICWDILVIPFRLFETEGTFFIRSCTMFFRVFWTLDIPFSFFVGYTADDGVQDVLSSRKVAKRYLRRRFPIDILLVICSWIVVGMDVACNDGCSYKVGLVLGILRAFQLLRLYRLGHVWRIVDNLFIQNLSEELALVTYICLGSCIFLIILHIFTCLWYWICDPGSDIYSDFEPTNSLKDAYVQSVYLTFASLIGEYVVVPEKFGQRCFALGMLLLGFVMVAAAIGGLTTALTRLQFLARQRSAQFATLRRFLAENAISRNLSARVMRNAQYAFNEKKMILHESQVELLTMVSQHLRAELRYEIHISILRAHPFLEIFDSMSMNRQAVETICNNAVAHRRITRGSPLFNTLEVPEKPAMFLITSGDFRYIQMGGVNKTLSGGTIVAEGALWTAWIHCGSMKAMKECSYGSVDACEFGKAMRNVSLPHAREYGAAFVNYLNACETPSDIGPDRDVHHAMVIQVFEWNADPA